MRVVPDPFRFPRRIWDDASERFEWNSPVWCDPGDSDDWIARAQARHKPGYEDLAAEHARAHYKTVVAVRAERIDLFTTMCRRSGTTPPSTLTQLFDWLLRFDLYRCEDVDGEPWLMPRLWQNPLDVLPLTFEEAADEARNQQHERAMLVGIGLRRLAYDQTHTLTDTVDDPEPAGRPLVVRTTLREVATHAGVRPGQVLPALRLLAADGIVAPADGGFDEIRFDRIEVDTPAALRVSWPELAHAFHFDEIPPPEHFA